MTLADVIYFNLVGHIPGFRDIWWLALWVPVFAAVATTAWARGAALSKRMVMGVLCGALIGLLYTVSNTLLGYFFIPEGGEVLPILQLLSRNAPKALWIIFVFMFMAVIGAFINETRPVKTPIRVSD